MKKAASYKTQQKWIPVNYHIDDEFNCLTNAENLSEMTGLQLKVGRTRSPGEKWGDHMWCCTPRGAIIDPYYQWLFPQIWKLIEYAEDESAFDGVFSDLKESS